MMHLEDYLVTVQLNDIEDIMYNDQIDEGKVKDALKKVWDFITGKNKKKKVKAAGSGEISKSKEDKLEEIDWNEIRKDIEFDDPLKRAKERAVQGGVEGLEFWFMVHGYTSIIEEVFWMLQLYIVCERVGVSSRSARTRPMC